MLDTVVLLFGRTADKLKVKYGTPDYLSFGGSYSMVRIPFWIRGTKYIYSKAYDPVISPVDLRKEIERALKNKM